MKFLTPRKIAIAIVVFMLSCCITVLLSGCRGPKQTTTSSTVAKNETTQQDERDQKILEQSRIISEQARRIEELQSGTIFFEPETSPCPETKPATVEITPGGGIKASGKIKSATVTNSKVQQDYNTLKQSYDSLAAEKQKSDRNQKTEIIEKEKQVIKPVIPWYMYFLLLIAFLSGGFLAWHKDKILPIYKPKS